MLSILRRTRILQNFQQNLVNHKNYTAILTINPIKLTTLNQPNLEICRYKSKTKKTPTKTENATETDSENDETTWDDQVTDKHTKVMQVPMKSLRVDGLIKAGFGIARNKIDTLFYESKLRVNGQKILKKSHTVDVGDEIDIIKGVSVTNPDFLTVARVEVLDIKEKGDTYNVKIRRCKSLTVDNYEDKWSPSNVVD